MFHFGGEAPRIASWVFSAVPAGLLLDTVLTQDYVLGYSQPSLRDSMMELLKIPFFG
jgi:hypothetical protein